MDAAQGRVKDGGCGRRLVGWPKYGGKRQLPGDVEERRGQDGDQGEDPPRMEPQGRKCKVAMGYEPI